MAYDSTDAAEIADDANLWRAALNRRYYAAFQACTAMLHYRRLTPPIVDGIRREAWAHVDLGLVVREQLRPIVRQRQTRERIASAMVELYQWRVNADYVATWNGSVQVQATAARLSRWIVNLATEVVGEVST